MNRGISSDLYVLSTPTGQILAVSEAMRPLQAQVSTLLADLVQSRENTEVVLSGRVYNVQRQVLWSEDGQVFGIMLAFRTTKSDARLGEMALTLSSKLE
ncbi:MAG: GGDEF domain-containing protein, partial [Chloroflexus sp.]|nr:GGDEF domain-containing protein [Chloroflexus sp.]